MAKESCAGSESLAGGAVTSHFINAFAGNAIVHRDFFQNGAAMFYAPAQQAIAFITEDRQKLGLMLHASVLENATIIGLREKIKGFFVNIKKFPPLIEPLLKELRVKTPSVWTEAVYLSGGNQQKVVLAKWLYAEQDIYIFDEPTRGIDVNAKAEFYKQMSNLTKQGKCILMISSDMPELISMSDRVLVVRDGRIDCELKGEQINEQEIIKRALGVNKDG